VHHLDAIVANVEIGGKGYLALFVLGSINIPDGSGFRYSACGDLEVFHYIWGYEAFCSSTVN